MTNRGESSLVISQLCFELSVLSPLFIDSIFKLTELPSEQTRVYFPPAGLYQELHLDGRVCRTARTQSCRKFLFLVPTYTDK